MFNDDEDDLYDIFFFFNVLFEVDFLECREFIEYLLNEDDDEEIDKFLEVMLFWVGCCFLVFVILIGNEGGSEDEIDYNEFKFG